MFTFTSFTSPARSSTILSSTGATAWHGPHHSAQKSTITGVSLWSTSWANVSSLTAVAIRWFLSVVSQECAVTRTHSMKTTGADGVFPRIERMFAPLPDKPDHPALELEILELWEREGTFEQLRAQNRGGPKFSFVDGPVTANRMSLGVHTAWGRTLKDVFQRYKALRGHDQRYQNGFDCQGLWIEVGVERALGLNSKREIEEYGLAEFARRCREVVVQSSRALTEGSIRLGQWMDWGKDYFTFSDTNIEYIWRFLRLVHERGWLYLGHRSTEWCPRCGTSISAHELRRQLRRPRRPVALRPAPARSTGRASRS